MTRLSLIASLLPALLIAADPPAGKATAHETYVEKIGDVKFTMVAVKGGTFKIGCPPTEVGWRVDEGPQRPVAIKPFWMGKCEVTWDEYRLYSGNYDPPSEKKKDLPPREAEADAVSKPTMPYIDETHGFGDAGYPAFNISHHAAMKYCEWLSKKTGKNYRLPTEAEWEYACRAGTTTAYSFGPDASDADRHMWHAGNSRTKEHARGKTRPVGLKKPNPWGLHDMHGNVAEWCLDHYAPDRYDGLAADKPTLNPVNMPTKNLYSHVARGGAFDSTSLDCRSASRLASSSKWNNCDTDSPEGIWWLANIGRSWVGFRVVRAVDEDSALVGIKSKVTKDGK